MTTRKAAPRARKRGLPPPAKPKMRGIDPPPAVLDEVPPARWRELLGDELADRAARAAAQHRLDPAEWCRRQILDRCDRLDAAGRQGKVELRHQERCKHPKERVSPNGRCGLCGARGFPRET